MDGEGGRWSLAWRWQAPLLYLLATLAMTYPAWLRPATHTAAGGEDLRQMLWSFWWVEQATFDPGRSIGSTSLLFHPCTVSLAFHSLSLGNTLPAALLHEIGVGRVLSFNLLWLASFWLGAAGAHWLAREEGASPAGAFLCGLGFAFSATRFAHLGHLDVLSTQWLPLFAWALLRTLRGTGRFAPVALAAAATLLCLCHWYFALYALLLAAILLAAHLLSGTRPAAPALRRLAVASLLTALALLPLVLPLLTELRRGTGVPDGASEAGHFSADLLAFFLPQPRHPLWRQQLAPLQARLSGGSEGVVTTGYLVMALALGAVLRSRLRDGLAWKVTAAVSFLMALGPQLKLLDRVSSPALLPYRFLVMEVPGLSVSRVPSRFAIPLSLAACVLSGLGWTALARRIPRLRPPAVATAVALLLLFECYPGRLPVTEVRPAPEVYREVAADPEPVAVLELPLCFDWDCRAGTYMLDQTFHGKPIVAGYLSRKPACAVELLGHEPVLAWLRGSHDLPATADAALAAGLLDYLARNRIGYVMVHEGDASGGQARRLVDPILGERRESVAEPGLWLYRVPAGRAPAR